jgi:hypothetical protein
VYVELDLRTLQIITASISMWGKGKSENMKEESMLPWCYVVCKRVKEAIYITNKGE